MSKIVRHNLIMNLYIRVILFSYIDLKLSFLIFAQVYFSCGILIPDHCMPMIKCTVAILHFSFCTLHFAFFWFCLHIPTTNVEGPATSSATLGFALSGDYKHPLTFQLISK